MDAIVLVVPGGPQNTVAWTDALEVDGVVLPAAAESMSTPRATPAVFSAPACKPVRDPRHRSRNIQCTADATPGHDADGRRPAPLVAGHRMEP